MKKFSNLIATAILWVILLVIDIGVLHACITVNPIIAVIIITSILALIFVFFLILAINRCIKCKLGVELPTVSSILKKLPMKKLLIILTAVLVIAAVIVGIVSYNLSAWKRNFEIKYIGYENSTYQYKITNLTSKTYRNVKVIVRVEDGINNITFEEHIGSIRQHEELDYNLKWSTVERVAKEKGVHLLIADVDIVCLEW